LQKDAFFSLLANSSRTIGQSDKFVDLKRPVLRDTSDEHDDTMRYDLLYAQNLPVCFINNTVQVNSLKRPRTDSDYCPKVSSNSPFGADFYDTQSLLQEGLSSQSGTTLHPQITPPQSVENPGSVDNNKQQQKPLQKSLPSFTINPLNTLKASYDDLNNIFEEDLDDQQQQQQQQNDALNMNRNHLIDCNMIVMTPPSHENPTETTPSQRTSPLVSNTTNANGDDLGKHQTSQPFVNDSTQAELVATESCSAKRPLLFKPFELNQLSILNNFYKQSRKYAKLEKIAIKDDHPKWSCTKNTAAIKSHLDNKAAMTSFTSAYIRAYTPRARHQQQQSFRYQPNQPYPPHMMNPRCHPVQRSNSQNYRNYNGQSAPTQPNDFNLNNEYASVASPSAVPSPFYQQPKTPSNPAAVVMRRNSLNRTTPISSPYPTQSYNQLPNTSAMSVGNTSAVSEQQPLSVLSSYGGADSPMSQHSTLNTSNYNNNQPQQAQRLNNSFYDTQIPTPNPQYPSLYPAYNNQPSQQQHKYPYLISNLQTNKMPVYQHPYNHQHQHANHYQPPPPPPLSHHDYHHQQNKQQPSSVCNTLTQTSPYQDINGVVLNMYLSDSLLNIYRDINFDSCTLCVCSNNNIKGMDHQIYIANDGLLRHHDTGGKQNAMHSQMSSCFGNDQDYNFQNNQCTCGFSSVVNRRLAYNAGLFYEDFVDIIGLRIECKYNRQVSIKPNLDTSLNTSLTVKSPQHPSASALLKNDLMQLFEAKYSCPLINFYDSAEIYTSYSRSKDFDSELTHGQLNFTIDENNVCANAIEILLQIDSNGESKKLTTSNIATFDYLDFDW
jgi:hypothetical protein